MSTATKRTVTGTISLLGALLVIWCIWRMIPYGMAGDTGKVKWYFAVLIGALLISLPCGVAYYYFKNQPKDFDRLRAEAEILARAGQSTSKPGRRDSPESRQPLR